MKINKTKIVVPALGLLLLSTAASITGSVAWFTANRTFKMTAGDFAVVNTKNNLQATLAAGIGTALGNPASGEYNIKLGGAYSLTDASFNHNSTTLDIVEPDSEGLAIDDIIGLSAAVADSSLVLRETNIYSVFTWDITFKISFSSGTGGDIGLYFNVANSLAREVETVTVAHTDNYWEGTWYTSVDGTEVAVPSAGNYQQYVAKGGEAKTGWFTNTACDDAVATDTLTKGSTYYRPGYPVGSFYKAQPDDTGKGFRLAFVPVDIPEDSMGYTRVWAPHQTSGNAKYINTNSVAAYSDSETYAVGAYVMQAGKMYKCKTAVESAEAFNAAKWELAPLADKAVAYSNTTSFTTSTGTPTRTVDATGNPIMVSGGSYTVPDQASPEAKSAALARANYLGFFHKAAGETVELKYTCVVWYEGTDPTIVNTESTIYETMATALEFDAIALTD